MTVVSVVHVRNSLEAFGQPGPDGKTVVIPDAWKDAWKFWYDGMWKDHTIMTGPVFESEEFSGGGYAFFSGRVAMSLNFLWTTYGVADSGTDWDLAAIPAHKGTVTSPLNADTFAIHKDTRNPDVLYLSAESGIFLTLDRGKSWRRLDSGLPTRQAWWTVKRQAMTADRQDPVGLYVGTTSGELWMSRDEGARWSCIARHLPEIYAVEAAELD